MLIDIYMKSIVEMLQKDLEQSPIQSAQALRAYGYDCV